MGAGVGGAMEETQGEVALPRSLEVDTYWHWEEGFRTGMRSRLEEGCNGLGRRLEAGSLWHW